MQIAIINADDELMSGRRGRTRDRPHQRKGSHNWVRTRRTPANLLRRASKKTGLRKKSGGEGKTRILSFRHSTINLSLDKFVIVLQLHLVDQRSYCNVSIQHESCSSHNSSCRLSGNNSTRTIVFFFRSNWRRRCLHSCIKILLSNQTIRSTSSRVVLHQTFFFVFLRSVPPSRNA